LSVQNTLLLESFLTHIKRERMLTTVILTEESPIHTAAGKVYYTLHMQTGVH
jgi:hypothetical protein